MNWDLLNELPKFTPWPLRLLGLEPWEARRKVAAELEREFETEKWGPLWDRVQASPHPVQLTELEDATYHSEGELICLEEGELARMTPREAFRKQYQKQLGVLSSLAPSAALVELGAGYGQIILKLAREEAFRGLRLLAGEYTCSGRKLIGSLAQSQGTGIEVGSCNFGTDAITGLAVPAHATIFTSYAAHYVPRYDRRLIDTMVSWHPAAVVHFEPLYELCDTSTLLGALQRRYIELNDYNRNLLEVLRDAEERGNIEILSLESQVFGSNPLLPVSVVIWKPRQ